MGTVDFANLEWVDWFNRLHPVKAVLLGKLA